MFLSDQAHQQPNQGFVDLLGSVILIELQDMVDALIGQCLLGDRLMLLVEDEPHVI